MASFVKQSRLIFIDSELNGSPNAVVEFPSQPFSVCCSDHMRLTLLSFQMRRNWYSVNATNNTFYIFNAAQTGAYVEVKIVPDSYESMDELAAAVQKALIAAIGNPAACTYDTATRRLKFTLAGCLSCLHRLFSSEKGNPAGLCFSGWILPRHASTTRSHPHSQRRRPY
jgi:hypothetical protein